MPTALEGVLIIEPQVFQDARGFFLETYHAERYAQAGLPARFLQDSHSCSMRGTIRGLHYQLRHPQGKLVRVTRGAAFDVAVDIRRGSPTFGRWVGAELSADNRRQLWIPEGFAHGFVALEEDTEFLYKTTDVYARECERAIVWNDSALGIRWPKVAGREPLLAPKDAAALPLAEVEVF